MTASATPITSHQRSERNNRFPLPQQRLQERAPRCFKRVYRATPEGVPVSTFRLKNRHLAHSYQLWQVAGMTAISIRELHEHTDLWVHRATEEEPIVVKDNGRPIARIVAIPAPPEENPFLTRQLLPGFAQLQSSLSGGTDSTEIISEMRDGR